MSVLRVILCFVAAGVVVAGAAHLRGEWQAGPVEQAKAAPPALSDDMALAPGDLDRLLAQVKSISVSDLSRTGWQHACLSRGKTAPPAAMTGCWPAPEDRNLGGSYLNVLDTDGDCAQWRTVHPIVDPEFEDSFCTAQADLPDLTLRAKNKLVDIE